MNRRTSFYVTVADRRVENVGVRIPDDRQLALNNRMRRGEILACSGLKEAWESAKIEAEVKCRFHHLRHSACTRLVERGVPQSGPPHDARLRPGGDRQCAETVRC